MKVASVLVGSETTESGIQIIAKLDVEGIVSVSIILMFLHPLPTCSMSHLQCCWYERTKVILCYISSCCWLSDFLFTPVDLFLMCCWAMPWIIKTCNNEQCSNMKNLAQFNSGVSGYFASGLVCENCGLSCRAYHCSQVNLLYLYMWQKTKITARKGWGLR